MRTGPALYVAVLAAASFGFPAHAQRPAPGLPVVPMAEEGKKEPGGHQHQEGDHKHKEGEHKEGEHRDEHHGEKKELGEKKVGSHTAKASQFGEVKPGEEAVFVVVLSGGSGKPKAVRGWVGVESGERSIKTKAEEEGEEYHLHHQVSKPLPKDSKLWVELETASGKQKVWFNLKK